MSHFNMSQIRGQQLSEMFFAFGQNGGGDFISVNMPFLGASPEDVEEGILIKIEESVQDIEGIGPSFATKLESAKIATTDDLLELCCEPAGRKQVAQATDERQN